MNPYHAASLILAANARELRHGHAFRLLWYLLTRVISENSYKVRVSRRRAVADLGMATDSFIAAERRLSALFPLTISRRWGAVFDFSEAWRAVVRETVPLENATGPLEKSGGTETGPLEKSGGTETGPLEKSGGTETRPLEKSGGTETGPLEKSGGTETGPLEKSGGTETGPLEKSGGTETGPLEKSGGTETGPLAAPVVRKPDHSGRTDGETSGHDLRSKIDLDRLIDPHDETREPNDGEIRTARSWLQSIRYQDGHEVHASAEACVYAMKAAGSMERLHWALAKLSARLKTNPAWRPKGARTLRPWLRKAIAGELEKLANEGADDRWPAAPDPPAAIPATGERFDTSAMVADLVGGVKRIR